MPTLRDVTILSENSVDITLSDALSRYSKAIKDLTGFGLQQGNIVGSLGEMLACKAMGLFPAASNTKGYDAVDVEGTKYQIKTRIGVPGRAIQLGAVRDLNAAEFFIAVILSVEMQVVDAWLIPADVFERHARPSRHVNAWLLSLNSRVLSEPSIKNIMTFFVSPAREKRKSVKR
ncbi:DUF6998 domain-containing protein [Citrobacter portucalensis]|uniref:DUF6998 domain-containing protein n=1 Tax=Citrobacter portucalensis TaxID=1639133 RepID=UPI003CEF26CE